MENQFSIIEVSGAMPLHSSDRSDSHCHPHSSSPRCFFLLLSCLEIIQFF